jgi:flagellin
MASEITRIANATDFNGIHLLNGNLSGAESSHNGSSLTTTGPLKVHFGTGNDSSEDYYYVSIDTATASALGLGLGAAAKGGTGETANAGKSISTQSLAQAALSALDNAIVSKDKIRASLGALQNRLENTITNLSIQSENTASAESQISDVDVATEMTEFTRQQIKVQTAVAMLSQANSLGKLALQLISG